MSKYKPKKRVLTPIEMIEEYLSARYNFRYNVVLGKVEYEDLVDKVPRELDDYKINSILRQLKKAEIPTSKGELVHTLQSDFVPKYDPFHQYFNQLPQWDEQTDYIRMLADTIKVSGDEIEIWETYLRRWLIGAVACALNEKDVNQSVIVLVGKQGVGKTKWMDKLVPRTLQKYYYSGNVNPNDKDSKIALAECFLINLDELENLNRGDLGSLKQLITQTSIRVRKPYAAIPENMPRRASFMGSVNSYEFLKDNTGNRRFLCVEALTVHYQHTIDMNKVYAQAYHLYLAGQPYWFNHEENEGINKANLKYKVSFQELDLVNDHFEPCSGEEEPDELLATTELQQYLIDQGVCKEEINIKKLGMALKASYYKNCRDERGSRKWRLRYKAK